MRRDNSHRNQYRTYWCRNLQRWPDVQKAQRRVSPNARRTLAAIAIAAFMIGGAKIASDQTMPGSGFSTVQTAAAEPTGAPGPTGGMTDGGGSQFQAPQMPSSMPDYQGGNQPPMNQDNGISIYQTGAQGAPQQGSQSGGQQPQQGWDQPAHGTQPPNYSTAPGYTQGPGQPNPNYQAPQQQSPQQGQQPQQPQQQQPSQAPTQTQQPEQPQNKQDDTTQQLNERQQKCQFVAEGFDAALEAAGAIPSLPSLPSGSLPRQGGPSRSWNKDPVPAPVPGECNGVCPPPEVKQQWGVIRTDTTSGWKAQINSMEEMKRIKQALEDANTRGSYMTCLAPNIVSLIDKVPVMGKKILAIGSIGCSYYNFQVGEMITDLGRAIDAGQCGTMDVTWLLGSSFYRSPCLW